MATAGAPRTLLKRWIHSREEDSKKQMVMRPHNYPFPSGKKRTGFELRADGSYVDIVDAGDGADEVEGTWKLEGFALILSCTDPSRGRTLKVRSMAEDRLVLEK